MAEGQGKEGAAGASRPSSDERSARLRASATFYLAHGLGNDYLVFNRASEPGEADPEDQWEVRPAAIRRVCDRAQGIGSDGVVILTQRRPADGIFPLRMFNPDGSEFERSGNGLRVLAAYLRRQGLVGTEPFRVRCGGAVVSMAVHSLDPHGRYDVSVEMGAARVGGEYVGLDSSALDAEGRAVHPRLGPISFVPVSVGNPHAVVFSEESNPLPIGEVGPFLATNSAFTAGVNVQVASVAAPDRLRIGIWERGAGPTLASGTSSCAAAVAAVVEGRLEPGVIGVQMEGGELVVEVTPTLEVTLRGPVEEVAEGRLTPSFVTRLVRESGPA